jgi:hypothetical protein
MTVKGNAATQVTLKFKATVKLKSCLSSRPCVSNKTGSIAEVSRPGRNIQAEI